MEKHPPPHERIASGAYARDEGQLCRSRRLFLDRKALWDVPLDVAAAFAVLCLNQFALADAGGASREMLGNGHSRSHRRVERAKIFLPSQAPNVRLEAPILRLRDAFIAAATSGREMQIHAIGLRHHICCAQDRSSRPPAIGSTTGLHA